MRRTAARIGVVAALALSMGVATAVALPRSRRRTTDGPHLVSRANDDDELRDQPGPAPVPPTWSEPSPWFRR